MTYCTDCHLYDECTKEGKDHENMILCMARIRPKIINDIVGSDEFEQRVSDRVNEILKGKEEQK